MDIYKLQQRSIEISLPIIQTLKRMDEIKVKLLFVFDAERFISILTIGDIQRAIIKGVSLTEPISAIVNTHKKS